MKKRRRIKKSVYVVFFGLIILIIAFSSFINYLKLINSNSYKLEKMGYSKEQVETILTLKEEQIDKILDRKLNKNIPVFIKQKYFLFKNLDRYLNYYKDHRDDKKSHIVSIVNVGADHEWYDKKYIKEADIKKDSLILINKFNHIDKTYTPKNIVAVSNQYAYGDNSITEEAFNNFKNMFYAAKKEDLTLIITSSYRNYETQEKLWNQYAYSYDDEYADSVSARPGYSEHQSGYAIDIVTYNSVMNDFEKTDEFKWLQKHAHEYGFILRYPKGKEGITGYDYESWHYRYVGEKVATEIKKKGITYDEYYAYYIEGDK